MHVENCSCKKCHWNSQSFSPFVSDYANLSRLIYASLNAKSKINKSSANPRVARLSYTTASLTTF